MKTLLLMRHAKSSRKDPKVDDFDRPLNKRGKKDAPLMGRFLLSADLVPQHILSSSAKRAIKTAHLVVDSCCTKFSGEIEDSKELYSTDPSTLIRFIRNVDNHFDRLLLISHNPELESLLHSLCRELITMPTASIARVALPLRKWHNLKASTTGELVNLWKPHDLR